MVTSLSVQIIEYIEPSNFWIGPRAVSYLSIYYFQFFLFIILMYIFTIYRLT